MPMIQLAVSAAALAAFVFGISRIAARLAASEMFHVGRRHGVDAVAAVALVGSLVALVQARWWASAAFEPAKWLVRVLFVGWVVTALAGGLAAVTRLGAIVLRLAGTEGARQRVERNLATLALAIGAPAAIIVASAVHAPVHHRNDEVFVLHQVRDYERIAELRAVARTFGTNDPELAHAFDLAVPSRQTENEIRRLFDRWDLADDPEYMRSAFVLPADASVTGLEPACVDEVVRRHLYWLTRWDRPYDDGLTEHTRQLADAVADEHRSANELLSPSSDGGRPGCSSRTMYEELVFDASYSFVQARNDRWRAASGD